ncbi:MAG: hypothetical protein HZR80_15945 [Candidatus Heimdallarchaeota archaeon]
MPIDYDTLLYLVEETIENAMEDAKEKLNELSYKYRLKIIVKPPVLVKAEQAKVREVIWEK